MSVIWASKPIGTTCRLGMPAKPSSNKYRLLHRWTLINQHCQLLTDTTIPVSTSQIAPVSIGTTTDAHAWLYVESPLQMGDNNDDYDCQSQSHNWGGSTNHNNDSLPSENVSDLNQGWSLRICEASDDKAFRICEAADEGNGVNSTKDDEEPPNNRSLLIVWRMKLLMSMYGLRFEAYQSI
jgi:hypothetical protein